jgi:curved DNA-binding protein CbpA
MSGEDLYRVLGLSQDASAEDIRSAFRRLAKQHHPDQGGDAEAFKLIQRAYHVLSDETRRAAYDATYIDGAALLDEVRGTAAEYVVFPTEAAADAVTLYAAATHAASRLECAPRLVIRSPVKRCGKSRLLDVLSQLVADPLLTVDISAAALVHSLDPFDPPTVILDEADAIFGRALRGDEKAEHLRGLLNAGFGRGRPYKRYNASTRQVEDCPTFALAILACIGGLPDTIEDRAVVITMGRKTPDEKVRRYRRRDQPRIRTLGEQLSAWVLPRARMIGDAEPALPDALNDRQQDAWEPLLAVADAAGGDWPKRAATAALELAAEVEADTSLGERLLADLRDVFGDADAMHGDAILAGLLKISEAPWGDYYGKPLNARGLARLLKPYGVASVQVRVGGEGRKGYRRDHLHDAWTRYLSPSRGGSETSEPSETPQVSGLPPVSVSDGKRNRNLDTPSDLQCFGVSEVSDTPPGSGQ